ncbi:MAG: polysaccharide biosynthesis/export family protein [Verrucomicrobiota bacterium]
MSLNSMLILKSIQSARRLPVLVAVSCLALLGLTGCQTASTIPTASLVSAQSQPITLREGDVLRIAFPGAPSLDTTQPIRRDGKIVLSMVGEVVAAGRTPADLQKELIKLCASQLVSKEVTVTVVSSTFPVFVTGAVLRPGKVMSDHPLSALEAVMEAGGFDYTKANLSAVVVIRQEKNGVKKYTVDLKRVLAGKTSEVFYLQTSDIVYVPEKFAWF